MQTEATNQITEHAARSYDWATEFHAFTPQHVVTLAVVVGLMAGACILGRRWLADVRRQRWEWTFRLVWICTTIVWQAAAVVWYLLPAQFDWYESLPLHLCDLAAWVAPLALLTQKRWLRSLLYFWGIGLSTQAFFTPVVEGGYGDIRFWLFFVGHTHIVGSAVYDVVVLGYRPRLRDWGVVTLLTLAWIVPVTVFNILMDVNYGYTGNTAPGGTTVIDYLGPWPWRLGTIVLGAQVLFATVYVPWVVVGRRRRSSDNITTESA